DAEDPGADIANAGQGVAAAPALEEGVLSGVLGVVVAAQEEVERADQFGAHLVEGAHEVVAGVRRSVQVGRPHGSAHGALAHPLTPLEEGGGRWDGSGSNNLRGAAGARSRSPGGRESAGGAPAAARGRRHGQTRGSARRTRPSRLPSIVAGGV